MKQLRNTTKWLRAFAIKEFKEKKPQRVVVYRVHSETIFKKGFPPNINVKSQGNIVYVVIVYYKDTLRVYYFTKDCQMLGAQNFRNKSENQRKIQKATTKLYEYPNILKRRKKSQS